MGLKKYEAHQRENRTAVPLEPTGVACPEDCGGEMCWTYPEEIHYRRGRAGEPGAVKSGMKRAVCSVCGWKGWV